VNETKKRVGQTFLSATEKPVFQIAHRRLPHWILEDAAYYITFRVKHDNISYSERVAVLNHILNGDQKYYRLSAAVIMPDHVHLIITPFTQFPLSRIMKGIKGVSARKINQLRRKTGSIWQDESFDRIIRDYNEFLEKLNYIYNNPIKAELCSVPEEYSALYICIQDTDNLTNRQTGMSAPPVNDKDK